MSVDKLKTAVVHYPRPKMPRSTWEALRSHIISGRKRKQEEEEKSEEFKRLKREREHREKQEASSLEETKEQIVELEKTLNSLKEDKHILFIELKSVLNEADSRRRKETDVQHQPSVLPLSGHVQQNPLAAMFMQSRPGVDRKLHDISHYMKPASQSPQLIDLTQTHQVKRPRSPSPPPRPPNINAVNSAYFRPSQLSHARVPPVSSVYGSVQPSYPLNTTTSSIYPFPATSVRDEADKKRMYLSQLGARSPGYDLIADNRSRLTGLQSSPRPLALTTSHQAALSNGYPLINTAAPSLASSQAAAILSAAASQQNYAAAARTAAQIAASQNNIAAARFYNVRDN